MTAKTAEKITKYTGLQIEVKKLWNIKEFRVMPIIFGALGTVSSGIGGYLKMVSPQAQFHIAQKIVMLGTAHVLRNFLTEK